MTDFWNPQNWCSHPAEFRIDNSERPAQQLCGKCGGIVQALDEQLLRDAFQTMAQQSGYPMPQIGVDMDSLDDDERNR